MEANAATEEAEIAEMVRGFLALQARTAAEENRPLRRGVHAKGMCVRGVFEVLDVAEGRDPALAARLAKGIYARAGSYTATVRFSNNDPNLHDDLRPDVRGLAFCAEFAPSGCAAAGVQVTRQDYSLQGLQGTGRIGLCAGSARRRRSQAPGIQLPWRPNGTRCGMRSVAAGSPAISPAARIRKRVSRLSLSYS